MSIIRLFFYILIYSIITINTNASLNGTNLSEHSDYNLHSEEIDSTYSYGSSCCSVDSLEFENTPNKVKKHTPQNSNLVEIEEQAIQLKSKLNNYITKLDINLITEAITSKSIKDSNNNYERLEFLGDAVLDALTSHILFIDYNKNTPMLFIKYTNNKYLAKKFKNLETDTIDIYKEHSISSKLWADIMESLIGCMFINQYNKSSNNQKINILPILRFIMKNLEIKSSVSEDRLFKLVPLYNLDNISLLKDIIKIIENLLKYKFNNKSILIEVLNNSSSKRKFSFLGRSILKLIVRDIAYNQNLKAKPNILEAKSRKLEKIIYASPFLNSTLKNNVLLLNKIKPKKCLIILIGSIYADHSNLYKTSLGIDTKNKLITSIILNNKINWN